MQLFESINLIFVPFLSRQFSGKRHKSLQVIDLHLVQDNSVREELVRLEDDLVDLFLQEIDSEVRYDIRHG